MTSPLRVLVIGGSGFVGRALLDRLGPDRGLGTWHRTPLPSGIRYDAATDPPASLLAALPAGFTHAVLVHGLIDVERCAADPAGTAAINVAAMSRMIDAVLAFGMTPVFASSDYVFDGARGGYREADPPSPSTEYGRQKLAIEQRMATLGERGLTVRLSRVIGIRRGTHSVLGPLAEEFRAGRAVRCAIDQRFSPADVDDTTSVLIQLMETGASGLYNLAGPEPVTRMELAVALRDAVRAIDPSVQPTLIPCRLNELPFREVRPLDTSLAIDKLLDRTGWHFRDVSTLCAQVAAEMFA